MAEENRQAPTFTELRVWRKGQTWSASHTVAVEVTDPGPGRAGNCC